MKISVTVVAILCPMIAWTFQWMHPTILKVCHFFNFVFEYVIAHTCTHANGSTTKSWCRLRTNLGLCQQKLGQHRLAKETFSEVLDLQPAMIQALILRARSSLAVGFAADALVDMLVVAVLKGENQNTPEIRAVYKEIVNQRMEKLKLSMQQKPVSLLQDVMTIKTELLEESAHINTESIGYTHNTSTDVNASANVQIHGSTTRIKSPSFSPDLNCEFDIPAEGHPIRNYVWRFFYSCFRSDNTAVHLDGEKLKAVTDSIKNGALCCLFTTCGRILYTLI